MSSATTTETPKTKKTRTKKPAEVIELPKIDIRRMQLTVDGDSSLISHRWSEKAPPSISSTKKKETALSLPPSTATAVK